VIRRPLSVLVALIALLAAACGGGATPTPAPASPAPSTAPSAAPPSAAPASLTIFAAASLKGVLDKAKAAYQAANPGTTLTISTDSSSALEAQIEQGAPADVFLSADTKNPQALLDKGFGAGSLVVFAGNKLTIVVPVDNPGGVTSPKDLGKSGLKIIAAGDEVPITRYAKQLVANLAALPGYPSDLATVYAAHVISREDNVKAVIAKIELGEGDAAIVYVTDAKASTKVTTVPIDPDSANIPATYAGVLVKASANGVAAKAFLEWFAGADGQAILAGFGFLPPPA
jgi:molybdate transport system substrate-binding protein